MSTYYRGEGARSYDQRHQHFTERTLSEALSALDVKALTDHAGRVQRTPRLLDVACGTGVLLSLLHEQIPGAELFGIDGSQDMLTLAHKRLAGVSHLRLEHVAVGQDAQADFPYPSESFDLITCTNALHALPDPIATLTALHRCRLTHKFAERFSREKNAGSALRWSRSLLPWEETEDTDQYDCLHILQVSIARKIGLQQKAG